MTPLDVGDDLVDREKSRLLLHYLARATQKLREREYHKRVHQESDGIEGHLSRALQSERPHHEVIHGKIKNLEHKLVRYVQTKHARKRRVRELELKVRTSQVKSVERENLFVQALADVLSLKKRFGDNASPGQQARLELKIEKLKHELAVLRKKL